MTGLRALASDVARAAASLLLERFGAPARGLASKTTDTDLVSDADRDAEGLITRLLREARPDDAILGEEGASVVGGSGLRWYVDPLDGTINFLYGIPHWCVTLACADGRGTLVGVTHDACRGETFIAERGAGAWLGERRLRVSEETDVSRSLVATGFGYEADIRRVQGEAIAGLLPRIRDIRRYGSAALDLAWVAAGRCDGYAETGVNAWDIEAGILLVVEAGGQVTRVDGMGHDRRPGVVATNGRIHVPVLSMLREKRMP